MTDIDDDEDKSRKERSPSFPFISLGKAVDRARAAAEAHKRSPTRVAGIAETWGYGLSSSGLLQTIAALRAYGLLEIIGRGKDRKLQLTDLAWRILHDQRPGAREDAIKEAAKRPRLLAEYFPLWLPERPSDSHCISELHLDRGFTQIAAELFLRVFDETAAFANLKESDNLPPSPLEPEAALQSAESAPVARPTTRLATVTADPYRVTLSRSGGIEIVGRLSTAEEVDDLVRSLNALKLLFRPSSDFKKTDESE